VRRILLVHNRYQQSGGEDTVFNHEKDLLTSKGWEVKTYVRSNHEIETYSPLQKLSLLPRSIWATDSARDIKQLLQEFNPEIVHFHNTFPLISPSAYLPCEEMGIPVVQSLHNPRLMCPAATFFRQGQLCQDCLGKTPPWPGVLHGCYRDSPGQTAVVATMLTFHRWIQTWQKRVNRYIVFTDFYREKFIEGGLPPGKIMVKPHFVHPDPGQKEGKPGDFALFIGRLEQPKGISTLLEAWRRIDGIELRIRGGGPQLEGIRDYIHRHNLTNVKILDPLSRDALYKTIKDSRVLIWPSEGYYETFGLVAIEAFACGVPVISSRIGVNAEIVQDQVNGLHFSPGDGLDLAEKIRWIFNKPDEAIRMGRRAREHFLRHYTAEGNYDRLTEIYKAAISTSPKLV
jgi:glycosyltransferase involved in cell wall biosynthesis